MVSDGYKEVKSYCQDQAAFAKAKAISTLSRKSIHFTYSLSLKIPVTNDTRWNSHFQLHEHILKYFEEINKALQKVDWSDFGIRKAQSEFLSLVVDVMQYFSEATNILKHEGFSTLNRVIPVVDSLENALIQTRRENVAINALCECLLTSLERRLEYLLKVEISEIFSAFFDAIM